jgi:hypothetical protein
MKFYLKMALLPFVYLLFTAMIGLGIMLLEDDLMWLQIFLSATNTIFYGIIVSVAGYKDGQKALRVREQNDTFRKRIVQTGEDIPLNVIEEYTPWKGFFIGALSCIPLVVLWIIHFIIVLATGKTATFVGGIAITLYVVIAFFFNTDVKFMSFASSFYFTALYVPFVVLLTGFGYLLGAKRQMKRQAKIEEYQRQFSEDI